MTKSLSSLHVVVSTLSRTFDRFTRWNIMILVRSLLIAPLRISEERKIVVWKFTEQCSVWELMNAATSRVSKAIMFFLTIHFFVFTSQSAMYFWVFFHTQLAQRGKHCFVYEYTETKTSIALVFSSITMCIKQNITEISHSFTDYRGWNFHYTNNIPSINTIEEYYTSHVGKTSFRTKQNVIKNSYDLKEQLYIYYYYLIRKVVFSSCYFSTIL